jgi:hypothetical protein
MRSVAVPRLPSTLLHFLLVSLANTALAQRPQSDDDLEEGEQTIAGHAGGRKNLTWEFAVIAVVGASPTSTLLSLSEASHSFFFLHTI